jgi:hypothetical protein
MPDSLAEEMIHSHDLQAVVDLTGSDGSWAMACIRARKPYVAVCFTEFHAKALKERLEHLVFQAMQHEKDPLYQPNLVEALKSAPVTDPAAPEPKSKKTPGPPKKKAKLGDPTMNREDLMKQLKALSKTNKASTAEDEGDEDESEPEDSQDD